MNLAQPESDGAQLLPLPPMNPCYSEDAAAHCLVH